MSGRGGPVGDHTPILGDAQIFYVAVLGMAGVLLCGELLAQLVTASASAAYGPALLTRMAASPQTVRWIYVFFVLLPACLAVLAIGFPFFLRTLIAEALPSSSGKKHRPRRHGVNANVVFGQFNRQCSGEKILSGFCTAILGARSGFSTRY